MLNSEIISRIKKIHTELNNLGTEWDAAFFIDKTNQYYLTGTRQDGLFALKSDGTYAYFARKSHARAAVECLCGCLYPMTSYKDVAAIIGSNIQKIYIETEILTYAALERLKKYFPITSVMSADKAIMKVRSVKTPAELAIMEESGRLHVHLLEKEVPMLLHEGISEAEFNAALYGKMIELGYHGVTRFTTFQTEVIMGQLGFGENSLYPTNFDGPGGMRGMSAAVPIIGDREKRLKKGDLVFVDIGFGLEGYHTDKTQVYIYGDKAPIQATQAHARCMEIQKQIAEMLKPGAIPGDIYASVIGSLDTDFLENFMGFGDERVKFLGHGIGLHVDEPPVIANNFRAPLSENMAIAVEPKKGISGFGMVGVEDTYVVTNNGGRCITGGGREIIEL